MNNTNNTNNINNTSDTNNKGNKGNNGQNNYTECDICPNFEVQSPQQDIIIDIGQGNEYDVCKQLYEQIQLLSDDIKQYTDKINKIKSLSYAFWYEYLLSYAIRQSCQYDRTTTDYSVFILNSSIIQQFISKYVGVESDIDIDQNGDLLLKLYIPSKIYNDRTTLFRIDTAIKNTFDEITRLYDINIQYIKDKAMPNDFIGKDIFWEPIIDVDAFAKSNQNISQVIKQRLDLLKSKINNKIQSDALILSFLQSLVDDCDKAQQLYDLSQSLINNWVGLSTNVDLGIITSAINNKIATIKTQNPELANCLPDSIELNMDAQPDDNPLNDADTLTNPDLLLTNKPINKLCYWQRFFAVVNFLALLPIPDASKTGFRYWAYGIVLPNGVRIPVPTTFIPMLVAQGPAGLIITAMAITGLDIRLLGFQVDSCGRIKLAFGGNKQTDWIGLFSLFAPEIIFRINDDIRPAVTGINITSNIKFICNNTIKFITSIIANTLASGYRQIMQQVINAHDLGNRLQALQQLKSVFEQIINSSDGQLKQYIKNQIYDILNINGITDISPINKIKPILSMSSALSQLSISTNLLPFVVLNLRDKIDSSLLNNIKSIMGIVNYPFVINQQNKITIVRALKNKISRLILEQIAQNTPIIDTSQIADQITTHILNIINPFVCADIDNLNSTNIQTMPVDLSSVISFINGLPDDIISDLILGNTDFIAIESDYDLIDMILLYIHKILSTLNIGLPQMTLDFAIPIMALLSSIEQMALGLQRSIVMSYLQANRLIIDNFINPFVNTIIGQLKKLILADEFVDSLLSFIINTLPDLDSFVIQIQRQIEQSNPCFMFDAVQSLFTMVKSQQGTTIINDLTQKVTLLNSIQESIQQNKNKLRHNIKTDPKTVISSIQSGQAISHPLLLTDQLPSYHRLNINNHLFIQHIDGLLSQNPDVLGF